MQLEFQGHPRVVEKESLVKRKSAKRSVEAWRDSGVCVTMILQQSSSVFRGRRRGGGPGDPEQQRKEVFEV